MIGSLQSFVPTHAEGYTFGVHSLYPTQRELVTKSGPVEIGARAFDLLVLLIESSGRVVSKREIFAAVWPITLVDDSNIRFQVAVLRRALGPDRDFVKTISGRGYLFTGRVERLDDGSRDTPTTANDDLHLGLAASSGAIVGLADARSGADVSSLRHENVMLKQALADFVLQRLNDPQSRGPWTAFAHAAGALA